MPIRVRLVWVGMWLMLFGALIELVQLVPALHRDGSIADLGADCFAITVTLAFATLHRNESAARFP